MDNTNFTKVDPIPQSIKQLYFKDKTVPNLSKDYDAIGFDADHCFVKYDIVAITKLIIEGGLKDLHEHAGYPREIMDFDMDSDDLQSCLNYSVFDIDHGLVVQLGKNKEIINALKGRRNLTQDEIKEIYKMEKPALTALEWPNLHSFPETPGANYWTMSTFFDSCKVPQILMGVEMIDKGLVQKTYQDLSLDMRKTVYRQYLHITQDKVLDPSTFGTFFPPVFQNPTKYIMPQPELIPVLQKLREQGKQLFVATNSHFGYMELIMSTTLGPKWREYFDFVFCFCRKPAFFSDKNPMYVVDKSDAMMKGKKLDTYLDMEKDSSITYLEGNAHLFQDFLAHSLNKKSSELKIAFFGDQYTSDVSYSNALPQWDGFAIVEEFTFAGEDYAKIEAACPLPKLDPKLIPYDKYWGDYFQDGNNYFVTKLSENCRYAVPLVRYIVNMVDF